MMKYLLIVVGVLAWLGVSALSIGMVIWDEPLWGFFPIAIGVFMAWAIGEYVTSVHLTREGRL